MGMQIDVVALLREFGLPTVLLFWFMFRMERRLDKMMDLLTGLLTSMALLAKAVDGIDGNVEQLHGEVTGKHPTLDEVSIPKLLEQREGKK